jgi:hypothetical protein
MRTRPDFAFGIGPFHSLTRASSPESVAESMRRYPAGSVASAVCGTASGSRIDRPAEAAAARAAALRPGLATRTALCSGSAESRATAIAAARSFGPVASALGRGAVEGVVAHRSRPAKRKKISQPPTTGLKDACFMTASSRETTASRMPGTRYFPRAHAAPDLVRHHASRPGCAKPPYCQSTTIKKGHPRGWP